MTDKTTIRKLNELVESFGVTKEQKRIFNKLKKEVKQGKITKEEGYRLWLKELRGE